MVRNESIETAELKKGTDIILFFLSTSWSNNLYRFPSLIYFFFYSFLLIFSSLSLFYLFSSKLFFLSFFSPPLHFFISFLNDFFYLPLFPRFHSFISFLLLFPFFLQPPVGFVIRRSQCHLTKLLDFLMLFLR